MPDAGLFIGWGEVVRGREERAVEVFNSSVEYWGGLQSEGKIESFEIAFLQPHGGELAGFSLIRGSEDQLDALRRDPEFERQTAKVGLIVDSLGIIDAALENGIARQMGMYQEEVAAVA